MFQGAHSFISPLCFSWSTAAISLRPWLMLCSCCNRKESGCKSGRLWGILLLGSPFRRDPWNPSETLSILRNILHHPEIGQKSRIQTCRQSPATVTSASKGYCTYCLGCLASPLIDLLLQVLSGPPVFSYTVGLLAGGIIFLKRSFLFPGLPFMGKSGKVVGRW